MATRFAHRAKLLAMDLTITAMQHTRSSTLLSTLVRHLYNFINNEHLFLSIAAIIVFGLAGFLIGYLSFFFISKLKQTGTRSHAEKS
jgi:hypothetical protein